MLPVKECNKCQARCAWMFNDKYQSFVLVDYDKIRESDTQNSYDFKYHRKHKETCKAIVEEKASSAEKEYPF